MQITRKGWKRKKMMVSVRCPPVVIEILLSISRLHPIVQETIWKQGAVSQLTSTTYLRLMTTKVPNQKPKREVDQARNNLLLTLKNLRKKRLKVKIRNHL